MKRVIRQVIDDDRITPAEVANLRNLQKRLGLDERAWPLLGRVYELVERRLENMILERAAYLSSESLVSFLKQEISVYDLSPKRQNRLFAQIERQHELAKLMAGRLPIITPSVGLYQNELCHLDIPASFIPNDAPAQDVISGKLLATSFRLMLLSASGGFGVRWSQVISLVPYEQAVSITTTAQAGLVFCVDPRYVATLIAAARRVYTPDAPPDPQIPNKRLA